MDGRVNISLLDAAAVAAAAACICVSNNFHSNLDLGGKNKRGLLY